MREIAYFKYMYCNWDMLSFKIMYFNLSIFGYVTVSSYHTLAINVHVYMYICKSQEVLYII